MNEIEGAIYKGIEKTLLHLDLEMKDKGISFDLSFNHNGSEETYFSEIEVTFWKDDNVLDEISVIIYIEGKKRNNEETFINWFKDELIEIIQES
jgi:hypothetical protein